MEIGIILLVVVVILGPTRLPKVAQSLGKGLKEFRGAARELKPRI